MMATDAAKAYPGALATAAQIRALAEEYRNAAIHLQKLGRRRKPLSLAPYRLAAIHAIELYLNAFLRHQGVEADKLRALGHHLGERAQLANQAGLDLSRRTVSHLQMLQDEREYVVTRYD